MANILITTQPVAAIDVFGAVDTILTIVPTAEQGVITYQWKVGTLADGSDLEVIADATTDSYTIPVDSAIGVLYYACLLSTDAELDDTLSEVVSVTVNKAAIVISDQPASQVVAGGEDPEDMTVVATYDGIETLEYQWYKCDNLLKANPVVMELGATDTITFGTMSPGYTTFYFCRLTADDATTVDSAVASVKQNGELPVLTDDYITGAYVLDYLGQCSAEVQERFTQTCALTGITFEDNAKVLRTSQLELFMSVI